MKAYNIVLLCFQIYRISNVECANLSDTAALVASSAFAPRSATAVLWRAAAPAAPARVDAFLRQFRGSVLTTPLDRIPHSTLRKQYKSFKYTQMVFFATVAEEFAHFLPIIYKDMVIPIRAILVLADATPAALRDATAAAWRYDVTDLVVVSAGDGDVRLSTYRPYGAGPCGDTTPVPILDAAYFPPKFDNFHGCPVRLSLQAFEPYLILENENGTNPSIQGIDGQQMNLVLESLNATMDLVSVNDPGGIGSIVNGSPTGSFADLVEGRADLFTPPMMMTARRYPAVQLAPAFDTLVVSWVGPPRREVHAWVKPLLPLATAVTPVLALTAVAFVLATKLVRRYALCRPDRRAGLAFQTFVLFLGQEVRFETECWLVNGLFVLWIWFCQVVRLVYQGDLVDGFQKSILEPPLGELAEALAAVDGYGGVLPFGEFYEGEVRRRYRVLQIEDVPRFIAEIAAGRRFLLATDALLVRLARARVQALAAAVTASAVCLHMRGGWGGARAVAATFSRVVEGGLTDKVMSDYLYAWSLHAQQGGQGGRGATRALDLATLGACFLGLLVMFAACALVLCAEIACHRYDLKQKLFAKIRSKKTF